MKPSGNQLIGDSEENGASVQQTTAALPADDSLHHPLEEVTAADAPFRDHYPTKAVPTGGSHERRVAEEASGAASSGGSICKRLLCFFRRAEGQYDQLMSHVVKPGISTPSTAQAALPRRRCCTFQRPFSGQPRLPVLEGLLTLHELIVASTLPMVTIIFVVYWTLLFPQDHPKVLWISVYMHLASPVGAWLLAGLSRFPYRLSMLPLILLAGLCYIVMIAVMQRFGSGFVYWFMNFQKRPTLASVMALIILLIMTPLAACISWFVLHRNNAAFLPPN
ncbi:hypothetical protein cyc_01607 [Cyclospora cayetanensis]|uniref:Transmembrane protein n=1 Tax=Cyclospora cayetanensis TaxID=88456 RepID=A0A1D3D953_9EIME|nr:hypothetical protein cyc_01607 [Cyclospora cayetanensis]